MEKIAMILLAAAGVGCHLHSAAQTQEFQPQQYSKTADIVVNGNVSRVFPLFGAFEERKWAAGWSPVPVYPAPEKFGEGTVFKSPGHFHSERELVWTVARYDTAEHVVEYVVTTPMRVMLLHINCIPVGADQTRATITYTFTGLTEEGNQMAEHLITRMYAKDLEDWKEALNKYLGSGK